MNKLSGTPPRAILYARVSTLKPTQAHSAARQLDQLRDLAKRRGWQVVASYTDKLSGGRRDRPGLTTALDLIFRGRAEILVVHDLDRLGRDVVQMLYNVDAIHAAGGNFFILDRNIDTSTAEGRLIFTIFGALAEFQRNSNRERILAGLAYARKKGVRLGRPSNLPSAVVDRAVQLRRQRPRPSWKEIVEALQREKLGRFKKGTIAGAVTRALNAAGCHPTGRAAARSVPLPAMARALELRRQQPPVPWKQLVTQLEAENLGRFPQGTIEGGVRRVLKMEKKGRLKSPPKAPIKNIGKMPLSRPVIELRA